MAMAFWMSMFVRWAGIKALRAGINYSSIMAILLFMKKRVITDWILKVFQRNLLSLILTWTGIWICTCLTTPSTRPVLTDAPRSGSKQIPWQAIAFIETMGILLKMLPKNPGF